MGAEGLAWFEVPGTIHVISELPTTPGTDGTKLRAAILREWARQRRTEAAG
ncbi:hypothetical protein [Saccharopolyspora gloriosae]|uniref:hypothetical protein n=1 Tax=Saccharopolyspora gloriosae TaxID=455344 RepID=UPI001FB66BF3|nr:hypothetical protein [Saccharopolyspora gloriosae]